MDMTTIGEEYIEILWGMFFNGLYSVDELKKRVGASFEQGILETLEWEGSVVFDRENDTIGFTDTGRERASLLIRSHRIAERLIADVLGGDFEEGACEFEHIKNPVLVDSICTMLGHPRECPHGLPIPQGECCRKSADVIKRSVVPLTSLNPGEKALIAYVYSKDDGQLHVMEGMQLRPGIAVKLHQKKPTYVIEVEDAHIALDPEVAANIQVWVDSCSPTSSGIHPRVADNDLRNDIRWRKRRWRNRNSK